VPELFGRILYTDQGDIVGREYIISSEFMCMVRYILGTATNKYILHTGTENTSFCGQKRTWGIQNSDPVTISVQAAAYCSHCNAVAGYQTACTNARCRPAAVAGSQTA
jgi:hypothetical protein